MNRQTKETAGREKAVIRVLSFGASVANQSTDIAKLVTERLSCVMSPEIPVVLDTTGMKDDSAFPPLLSELQAYFQQIRTSLDKIKNEINRMEI